MRRINRLPLAFVSCEIEHGPRDLVPTAWGQPGHPPQEALCRSLVMTALCGRCRAKWKKPVIPLFRFKLCRALHGEKLKGQYR
jgi:hypothetical protein